MTTTEREPYLTVAQAAAFAAVTERTLRRWVAEGRLPTRRTHPSKHGGHLRVRLSDVERLLSGVA